MIKVGSVYRNVRMRDVDFYVTKVTDKEVYGYWILRSSKNMLKADTIKKDRVNYKDWKEVVSV